MNKFIESERLYLREIMATDEDELLELDSDPEVMRYLSNGSPTSRESIKKMMLRISAQLKESSGKYGLWAAIEKESHQFIGWFHLFPSKDDPQNLNSLYIGYRLKKKILGKWLCYRNI